MKNQSYPLVADSGTIASMYNAMEHFAKYFNKAIYESGLVQAIFMDELRAA